MMLPSSFTQTVLFVLINTPYGSSSPSRLRDTLPIVDLGYTQHQAYTSTDGYYNFTNVRFGLPPTGKGRFKAPVAPTQTNKTITNGGSRNIVCPQATPTWNAAIIPQLTLLVGALARQNYTLYEEVLEGVVTNTSAPALNGTGNTTGSSDETEDCLFLDLIVPQSVWAKRGTRKAPVLVWLYGGGYVYGSKRDTSSPSLGASYAAGLVDRSIQTANEARNNIEPTIVVLPNYRLGLFGWLGGQQVANDGIPNAGLHDQLLALKWVQKYIGRFGGDPENVVVMGESAGAGSIEHHITSKGGIGKAPPFRGAVMQSTTFYPVPANDNVPEKVTEQILTLANCSTLKELRQVATGELQEINELVVSTSLYGFWTFGPVVDGSYVPDLPGRLLLEGRFHRNISVMMGHNENEGFVFTPPTLQNKTSAFSALLAQQFPEASTSSLSAIKTKLYPPTFDMSDGYTTEFGRQQELYDDSQFVCNNLFIADAFNGSMYWYDFNVLPGYHGQDLPYTWAAYPPLEGTFFNSTVATALQEYILSFAANGIPRSSAGAFDEYGSGRNVLSLSTAGIQMVTDETSIPRCAWWQRAPYSG